MFQKSLKSNAGMAKSLTQTVRSQSNHVFMAIYAVFKLECLSVKSKLNPFAESYKKPLVSHHLNTFNACAAAGTSQARYQSSP